MKIRGARRSLNTKPEGKERLIEHNILALKHLQSNVRKTARALVVRIVGSGLNQEYKYIPNDIILLSRKNSRGRRLSLYWAGEGLCPHLPSIDTYDDQEKNAIN